MNICENLLNLPASWQVCENLREIFCEKRFTPNLHENRTLPVQRIPEIPILSGNSWLI